MIFILQLYFYHIFHGQQQLFEFWEPKLIQIKRKSKLLFKILRQLGQRHPILGFKKYFN